jgi:hypothetical protein
MHRDQHPSTPEASASTQSAVPSPEAAERTKKPRKLVEASPRSLRQVFNFTKSLIQDEHREEGQVKWSIYVTYLEASSVHSGRIQVIDVDSKYYSSYWTWILLALLTILDEVRSPLTFLPNYLLKHPQLLALGKTLWLKVRNLCPSVSYENSHVIKGLGGGISTECSTVLWHRPFIRQGKGIFSRLSIEPLSPKQSNCQFPSSVAVC